MDYKIKFDMEFCKWVIDIETDNGEIIPVREVIDKNINLFEISKWDTYKKAEEWLKTRLL